MKVFWSWQSDLESKTNRTLIKGAITDALNLVTAELELNESERPEIDHDTKGASGAIDIAKEILDKIESAVAFIADVTPIAVSDKGKKLPNPNVMIELGYAFKAPGFERVIPVLNTAFGSKPDDLPFDLRNRRCMTYDCPSTASASQRNEIRKQLARELASALINNLPQAPPFDYETIKTEANKDGTIWNTGDQEMEFTSAFVGGPPQKYRLADGPLSYIRIIPAGWESPPLSLTKYLDLQTSKKPACPSSGVSAGSWGASSNGAQNFWFRGVNDPQQQIVSITKYFEDTGEIWACRVAGVHDERVGWIPMVRHWHDIIHSTNVFLDEFGAKPARYIEIGFAGLSGFTTPGQFSHDRLQFRKGEMSLNRASNKWDEEQMSQFLLDAMNEIHNNLMLEPTDIDGLKKLLAN